MAYTRIKGRNYFILQVDKIKKSILFRDVGGGGERGILVKAVMNIRVS
jgi:hypothetical protein